MVCLDREPVFGVVETFYTTPLIGGIVAGEFGAAILLIIPLAALMILGRRAAIVWSAVYVVVIIASALIPNFVDPVYNAAPTDAGAAENLIFVGVVIMAITLYFVRQRDRFQKQSDDLLHNILPDEVAARLKTQARMIAGEFPEASVLLADVVGFTPMLATMTPTELVGLLNRVFSVFDGFVADLGLEKIKTVGDEYMVAAGVPVQRPDHAEAIAELALRIEIMSPTKTSTDTGSASGSASTAEPSSPGSSEPTSSPTTSGATRSTWRAGWSQAVYPVRSRQPHTYATCSGEVYAKKSVFVGEVGGRAIRVTTTSHSPARGLRTPPTQQQSEWLAGWRLVGTHDETTMPRGHDSALNRGDCARGAGASQTDDARLNWSARSQLASTSNR